MGRTACTEPQCLYNGALCLFLPTQTELKIYHFEDIQGARGGGVGLDTALQDRRSLVRFPMVWLEFFIDIILPAAL